MRDVRDALDRMQPHADEHGDWEAVVRDAGVRPRRALVRSLVALAAAVAAVSALVLFQPWEGESPTVLERALAAVGDGPVLHVVLRGEWGGTLVDLTTGERQAVHGENEIWYDSERGLVHHVSRLGGTIQYEEVYEPRKPPPELVALGRDYREALRSRTAQVDGEGVVDGVPVLWITIRSSRDLDVADGRLHEWRQQVGVSRETFEPMSLRETRDGEPGPLGTRQRVLELELLPSGQGDFTAPEAETLTGRVYKEGREAIPLEQAAETLGGTPFWLGRGHAGLPLAQAFRTTRAVGRSQTTRRGRVARIDGPPVWEQEQIGLQLFYGAVGDDPSTYREDLVPRYAQPHLTVTQTNEPSRFGPGVGDYIPPEGSVFIAAGGRMGVIRAGGLHVTIEASSEELILSAARALEPMSA